jgi:predicted TIM-barrel fold metal-dependent hydrolase
MKANWMLSSDSHIVEPPTLFTDRIDRRWREHAPRVIEEGGVDWWMVGDEAAVPAVNPSRAGDRFDAKADRHHRVKLDQGVRAGGYEPDAWIQDNESDGVYGGVLFPSLSLVFYGIKSSDLLSAVCRVFTDWVIEFASAYPTRLRAIAMINLDDVDAAVVELERARKAGASGAMIPVLPLADRPYSSPEYERFWAAAESLDMPLNLHVATNRTPGEWKALFSFSHHISAPDYWVRTALADIILSGVFERHPGLRVGSVENEAGWAAFFLRRMDHLFKESLDFEDVRPNFKNDALPSDFFHRNVFVSFAEDEVAIANRDVIGVENLMWGNDYPHGESTFPRSREIVGRQLAGLGDEERLALTASNVAALYKIDMPAQ